MCADQRRGGIAWTDFSVNPIRARLNGKVGHHCVKVSPGCTNCYASKMQPRFGLPPYEVGKRVAVEPFFDGRPLREVLRRRKPARYFWCDMTDLFGEWVPDEWIDQCFAAMALTPQHTHQCLTKRPERMRDYMRAARFAEINAAARAIAGETDGAVLPTQRDGMVAGGWPLPCVWLGVSVEDQQRADERIPLLLQTPAAVRFVSYEPALAPIDARRWMTPTVNTDGTTTPALSWLIAGGESGPNARACDVAWIRDIVRQCQAAGMPVFVKQLGTNVTDSGACDPTWAGPDGKRRDRKGADPSEWPRDLRIRQYPGTLNW